MRTLALLNFVKHIRNMALAEGKKKIWYAIGNTIIIAFGFLFAWLISIVISNIRVSAINPIVGLTLVIILSILVLFTMVQGVIAQVILVFLALMGIFHKGERLSSLITFLISLLTIGALIGVIFILSNR